LTSPGGIADTAARAALQLADGKLARRERRRPLGKRLLESAPLRSIVLRKAREQVRRRTRGNYPAPPFILDCVEAGLARGPAAGFAKEAELFGKLVAGPEAKNLIRLFDEMNDLKKPQSEQPPRPVRRLAVLGGGFMGSGIAEVSVPLSPVTVKDVSDEVLARCARQVREGLDARVRSQAVSRFERDRLMARLYLTTDGAALRGADLVIEAVFEELELKRRILAEAESAIAPETVFASNTSALPITQIASKAQHPERVLGMHYFSPVPKMPLLEIVITDQTAPWATATARDYGIRQGKTVIVVRDGPGFYTSRILSPYLGEAMHLLAEGARVEDIDAALKDFGYPVGPMALLDEVGIDVAAHVSRNLGAVYAHRGLAGGEVFVKLHEAGYSGRKNKRGFYLYDGPGKKKQVNEQAYAVLGAPARRAMPRERIAERLALLMANEAVYCLDESILASPRDGDVGAILGLGFPPFRGGPFTWLDTQGLAQVVTRMERLRDEHGPRFEPAPLLRRLASEGETFSGS
jgi:3-hydroxyacyl-CoA dehydrogenase